MSFRFLLWQITIEPLVSKLSPFELTMYDARWWKPEAFMARWQRNRATPIVMPIEMPPETPLLDIAASLPHQQGVSARVRTKRGRGHYKALQCEYCGKAFGGRKGQKFCTPAHRQAAWKAGHE